jgi:hypothetical protein
VTDHAIADMSSTKKAVAEPASRPCKMAGPANATMAASTTSTRSTKSGSNARVTKARSQKSSYRYVPKHAADDDDDEEEEEEEEDDGNFSTQSESTDDELDFDNESNIADDTDDEYTGGANTKSKGAVNTKPKSKPKKDGTGPDPNGRVKGRDLIPWTSKSSHNLLPIQLWMTPTMQSAMA